MTKIVALAAKSTFLLWLDTGGQNDVFIWPPSLRKKMVKKAIRRSQATFSAHFTPGKMVSYAEGTGWMKQAIGHSTKTTKNVEKCQISYAGAGMLKKNAQTHDKSEI